MYIANGCIILAFWFENLFDCFAEYWLFPDLSEPVNLPELYILSSPRCFNVYSDSSFFKLLEIIFLPCHLFSIFSSYLGSSLIFPCLTLINMYLSRLEDNFFFLFWLLAQAKRRSRTKWNSVTTLSLSILSSPFAEQDALLGLKLSPMKFIPLLCSLLSVRTLVYFSM